MPSSYTTSGIELIGDGEQSGSWGDTTNTNLEIIDRLTSRAGSISLSGTTHTLTLSDGTLSDGHYAVLVFGGSPSGTNTVTISPNDAQRVFIVKNDSGESVILTQGSGGNVTVADGSTAIVYCDGQGASAAVVNVSDDLVSSTLAAISALTPTDGNFIVGNGTTWVAESGNTALASLGVTATATELNTMDGITASTSELNVLDGITASTAELNIMDGVTATTSELNILDGVTANASELNLLDGVTWTLTSYNSLTATAAELNVLDGISGIASQVEAEAGTASNKLMTPERTKEAIEALTPDNGIGVGQTWQDMSGSRSFGVSYQNTTGKPIQVAVDIASSSTNPDTWSFEVSTDGSTWLTILGNSSRYQTLTPCVIIPNNHYYRLNYPYSYNKWSELR